MIILLSPAKSLDVDSPVVHASKSAPRFGKETQQLVELLSELTVSDIGALMSVSPALAELNHQRYADFHWPIPKRGSASCLDAFRGDVYRGLKAESFKPRSVEYANDHLRILSGLYGILKPLDRILPYRLEMGTKLQNPNGKDLYHFWGEKIGDAIRNDLDQTKSKFLLNLASNEYFKACGKQGFDTPVVAPKFREIRKGKPVMITLYSKIARGTLASWVIRKRARTLKKLTAFDEDGYQYSSEYSTELEPMFVRHSA